MKENDLRFVMAGTLERQAMHVERAQDKGCGAQLMQGAVRQG